MLGETPPITGVLKGGPVHHVRKVGGGGCSQVGYRQAEVAETISFFQSFNVSFLLTCIYFWLYQLCEFWPSRFSATFFLAAKTSWEFFHIFWVK